MRHAVLLALTSLLLVTSGCKSQCRLLSEKACDCTVNSTDKTACLTRASQQDSTFNSMPTAEDEDRCEALLEQCDCRLVDTAAGKMRCGLAN
ncbi:MAG: hypothetical protein Q8N23_30175 [Archangium sp.]|nr:hypothetical protein [Archangium sp.]MDP3156977.1 hypothetical protein [Archangium sp.]MDP3574758.1 hypothetical protein [Archangium sp.]